MVFKYLWLVTLFHQDFEKVIHINKAFDLWDAMHVFLSGQLCLPLKEVLMEVFLQYSLC